MPTTKKRINISVSDEVNSILKALSKRNQIPVATVARQLLLEAIELEEDAVLHQIATERERDGSKPLTHKQVWG